MFQAIGMFIAIFRVVPHELFQCGPSTRSKCTVNLHRVHCEVRPPVHPPLPASQDTADSFMESKTLFTERDEQPKRPTSSTRSPCAASPASSAHAFSADTSPARREREAQQLKPNTDSKIGVRRPSAGITRPWPLGRSKHKQSFDHHCQLVSCGAHLRRKKDPTKRPTRNTSTLKKTTQNTQTQKKRKKHTKKHTGQQNM